MITICYKLIHVVANLWLAALTWKLKLIKLRSVLLSNRAVMTNVEYEVTSTCSECSRNVKAPFPSAVA